MARLTRKLDVFKIRRMASTLPIILILIISACDTPIAKYTPKSPEEKAVISVLIQYQDAKNRYDIKKLMALLHDKGQFSYACGIPVSKAELSKRLPEFWDRMKSEKLAVVPMAHECLNGDYYSSGVLKEPVIEFYGSTARARVRFTKRFSSSLFQYFRLVHEKDQWLITRTEWGPS